MDVCRLIPVMHMFNTIIPFIGSLIASTLSFGCTLIFLRNCLKEIEEVALAVLKEAKQQSVDSFERE